MGGKDNKDNLVELSAREHFICHLLLTKMYPEGSVEWIKMTKAFMCMMFRQNDMQKRYLNSRWYSFYREKFSKAQSLNQKGQNNSNYGSCWIINLQTGDIKRIKKIELQTFLEKGYVRGRTLNDRYRMTQGKYKKLSTQQKEDFDKAMSLWYQEKNSDAKVEDFINTKDTNLKTKLDTKLRKYHIAPKYLDGMNEDQLRKLADDNFSDTKANRDYLKGTKLENIITDEVLKDYGKEETLDLEKNTAIEAIDKNAYTCFSFNDLI